MQSPSVAHSLTQPRTLIRTLTLQTSGHACVDLPVPQTTVRRAHSALVRGNWIRGGAVEPVATERQRVRRMQTTVASEIQRQLVGDLLRPPCHGESRSRVRSHGWTLAMHLCVQASQILDASRCLLAWLWLCGLPIVQVVLDGLLVTHLR